MFLKSLKLTNFRNYSKLSFNFKHPITVLVGDNAQGKTNFLESIYFLATTKSTKADADAELIKAGKEVLRVEGVLDGGINLEIAIQIMENSLTKRVKVNGIPRRVIDYAGNLVTVLFAPEDINLVTGSPSLRRYYIDSTLSQIDRNYKKTLSSYENILTRKNKILKAIKEGMAKISELTYWIDQQVELGEKLSAKRQEFFNFVAQTEKKFGDFEFEYLPSPINQHRLTEYQDREIQACTSLVGPHRDDFAFKLKGLDLAKFGSRGEQRTSVLDLKLAEVAFIEHTLGDRPVLLLDDIFSELDESHREHVIELSKLQQTIISTVEWDAYLKKQLKEANLYDVENGQLSEIADR